MKKTTVCIALSLLLAMCISCSEDFIETDIEARKEILEELSFSDLEKNFLSVPDGDIPQKKLDTIASIDVALENETLQSLLAEWGYQLNKADYEILLQEQLKAGDTYAIHPLYGAINDPTFEDRRLIEAKGMENLSTSDQLILRREGLKSNNKSSAAFTGSLKDFKNVGIRSALVEFVDTDGEVASTVESDTNGEFIVDLPDGMYTYNVYYNTWDSGVNRDDFERFKNIILGLEGAYDIPMQLVGDVNIDYRASLIDLVIQRNIQISQIYKNKYYDQLGHRFLKTQDLLSMIQEDHVWQNQDVQSIDIGTSNVFDLIGYKALDFDQLP